MNEKHFIWIIPVILIIGFVIGYISGLHIPKDITIGIEKETLETMKIISENNINKSSTNEIIDFKNRCNVCCKKAMSELYNNQMTKDLEMFTTGICLHNCDRE